MSKLKAIECRVVFRETKSKRKSKATQITGKSKAIKFAKDQYWGKVYKKEGENYTLIHENKDGKVIEVK